jgi:phenylalanyl-tRNA synthetase beta chain
MKFTLSWLREFLDTEASIVQITEKLTAIGLEVEEVIDHAADLKPFIVAEIIAAEPHPGADKLRVCKVQDGTHLRQIVCGAPNARAGIKVVLATEGVKIPGNGMIIKKASIRGVESNGMLCSAAELGIGEDGGGIIELPAHAIVGESIVGILGLDDPVIDIAITPNRADCLGVQGIARDLAAAGLGIFRANSPPPPLNSSFPSPITVTLATPACPLFIGYTIRNVKNGPSPDWLQQRLKAIGLRPISILVDITNYMTIAYNRPLHVYDAKKLQGNITVRFAKNSKTVQALNDKEYTLSNDMIAICDDSGAIGLGGIIGGISTSCDAETTDVFLEAALFDPAHIASTGRALNILSDARYRFERGIDPAFTSKGAEIAVAMIVELCGGDASQPVIAGREPDWKRSINFNTEKVKTLGAISIPDNKITDILTALGFEVNDTIVMPPSWRADIQYEADLVEEIVRISGYDTIPTTTLPYYNEAVPAPEHKRNSLIRKTLATKGLTEICSWAFVGEEKAKTFGGINPTLELANPISTDLSHMRPSLLPGLLDAVHLNNTRGFSDLALFEIGNVFADTTPGGQKLMAAGLRSANTSRNHFKTERPVDIFDAKADLFNLLETAGLNPAKLMIDRKVPDWYHPSRSGRISLGGKITLGYFGEIHPVIAEMFHVKHSVVMFEAFLDAIPIPKNKSKSKASLVLSPYQAVERDFAFMADVKLEAADIVKAVEKSEQNLIRRVNVFDVYTGKGVEPGKKSIAISVTLQAMDHTLTEAEIEAVAQKIIASGAGLGLVLRQQ